MTFSFRCPHCRQQGRGDVEQARADGGRWTCDACGKVFRLKMPDAPAGSSERGNPTPKPPTAAKPKPRNLQAFDGDGSKTASQARPAASAASKPSASAASVPAAAPAASAAPEGDSGLYDLMELPPEPEPEPEPTEEERAEAAERAKRKRRRGPKRRDAGLVARLVALIVDSIVLGVITLTIAIGYMLATGNGLLSLLDLDPRTQAILTGAGVLIFLLYFTLTEMSDASTIGKGMRQIRVVDPTGNRIGIGRSVLRAVFKLFGPGYLVAPFTRRKRALHDLVAGTYVVDASHEP